MSVWAKQESYVNMCKSKDIIYEKVCKRCEKEGASHAVKVQDYTLEV